jgi:hypothetical protein
VRIVFEEQDLIAEDALVVHPAHATLSALLSIRGLPFDGKNYLA